MFLQKFQDLTDQVDHTDGDERCWSSVDSQLSNCILHHHPLPPGRWLGRLPPLSPTLIRFLRRPSIQGGRVQHQGEAEGQHLWLQDVLLELQQAR